MSFPPSPQRLKTSVRELYARLAAAGTTNLSNAPILSGESLARSLGYDTTTLPIVKKAWGLFAGCGNPLEEIEPESGWTVLDLGCGAGIDCQVAAFSPRPPGRVIGLDITPELLQRAREYASALPIPRCYWIGGDCEKLPLQRDSVHLAVANGSFNLMPDKKQVLGEIYRVLKSDGKLALADLIRVGDIDTGIDAGEDGFEDAWAWCLAGALSSPEYDTLLKAAGFACWKLTIKLTYGPFAVGHLLAHKA